MLGGLPRLVLASPVLSPVPFWLSCVSLFLTWSLSLYFSYSHSPGIWGTVEMSQVVRMEPNTVRGGSSVRLWNQHTPKIHTKTSRHRGLLGDMGRAGDNQDQQPGRYHGTPSSLPSTLGQPFLPALL